YSALLRVTFERLDPVELFVGEELVATAQACPFGTGLVPLVLACQQAAREREVRQHAGPEALARREQLLLYVASQQRVLVLRAHRHSQSAVATDRVDLLHLPRLEIGR